ncbi:MAG: c-type cytochrome [Hyphomicrobiaceae bacterium]
MSDSNSRRKRWLAAAGLHLVLLWGLSASTSAQETQPSAERGRDLAIRLCQNCHLLDSATGQTVPAGTPTFRSMATEPSQTRERVLAALIQPHVPMPDVQLSRAEIDDVIAYLDAIRAEHALPPLLPPLGEPKPTLPSKS